MGRLTLIACSTGGSALPKAALMVVCDEARRMSHNRWRRLRRVRGVACIQLCTLTVAQLRVSSCIDRKLNLLISATACDHKQRFFRRSAVEQRRHEINAKVSENEHK